MALSPDQAAVPAPDNGATRPRTGAQRHSGPSSDLSRFNIGLQGGGGLVIANPQIPSWSVAPSPTPNTYRRMRTSPSIALARMVLFSPIKGATWTVEAGEDAPEGAAELVKKWVTDEQYPILAHAIRCLEYGWSPFEIVWGKPGVIGAERPEIVPLRLKPLSIDRTIIMVSKDSGDFVGFRNGKVNLLEHESLLFTHDGEAEDPFGRSIYENVRENAWWPWSELLQREGRFTTKVAGSTLAIGYPPGEGTDENGTPQANWQLADQAGQAFGKGSHVIVPRRMREDAEELLAAGVTDIDKLMEWKFEFFEPGTGHAEAFIAAMEHHERGQFRGLLVPERAATEGRHGTLAEAEAHADLVLVFGDECVTETILPPVNKGLVDRMMLWNYGPDAVGTVHVKAEPIADEKAGLIRQILVGQFSNPANLDALARMTDLAQMAERIGLLVRDDAKGPVPFEVTPPLFGPTEGLPSEVFNEQE